jgi:peroxiredoxin/YHS domain-containing protein
MLNPLMLALIVMALVVSQPQDKAIRIKGNLPAKAHCFICKQNGELEQEKPAGGVSYKDKTYYFCNKAEIESFLKDPDAFIPAPLPRTAVPFTLKTTTGTSISLADMRGKLVLIDFWATWCVPCVKSMPAIQKLHTKYSLDGLAVIGISIDDDAEHKVPAFLKKSKQVITYPILLDNGDTWKQLGVKAIPSVMLVKDAEIIEHWSGKIDMKAIEVAIQQQINKQK